MKYYFPIRTDSDVVIRGQKNTSTHRIKEQFVRGWRGE